VRLVSATVRFFTPRILQTICLLTMIAILSHGQIFAQVKTVEELNKKLVHIESEEIGNKGNLRKIPELYNKDFVRHFLSNNSQTSGLADFKSQMAHLRKAFPDRAEQIKLIVAEKDMVAIWFVISGTNTGSFLGHPPTGKKTVDNVMSFFRIAEGKIAEQWLLPDLFALNSQLGIMPGVEPAEPGENSDIPVEMISVETNDSNLQRNKEVALQANERIWSLGDLDAIEELFADEFVQHFLPLGNRTEGLDAFREQCTAHRNAFPDWTEAVNLVVAEGDYVFLQFTSTGTNTGTFLGNPPTGKTININEVTIFRMVDGKIAEQWLLPDILSLNQQLGLIPSAD
jgi:steroid delta-isomerase-like uncharacterized protein